MITVIASCVAFEIDMAADVALKFPARPETVSRPGVVDSSTRRARMSPAKPAAPCGIHGRPR